MTYGTPINFPAYQFAQVICPSHQAGWWNRLLPWRRVYFSVSVLCLWPDGMEAWEELDEGYALTWERAWQRINAARQAIT